MSNTVKNLVVTTIEAEIADIYVPANLKANVEQVIEKVATHLSTTADNIADTLRAEGSAAGLSESEVENVLIKTGLVDAPEPEVEVEPISDAERIAILEQTVATLVEAAKQNGISLPLR